MSVNQPPVTHYLVYTYNIIIIISYKFLFVHIFTSRITSEQNIFTTFITKICYFTVLRLCKKRKKEYPVKVHSQNTDKNRT